TWRRLMASNAICVQGVGDRALATVDVDNLRATSEHDRARLDRLRATRGELGELILARLAKLPKTSRIAIETGGEILLVHGPPLRLLPARGPRRRPRRLPRPPPRNGRTTCPRVAARGSSPSRPSFPRAASPSSASRTAPSPSCETSPSWRATAGGLSRRPRA